MKAFFEEYGFVILSAIAIIALIGFSSTVGEKIGGNLTSLVEQFQIKVTSALNPTT